MLWALPCCWWVQAQQLLFHDILKPKTIFSRILFFTKHDKLVSIHTILTHLYSMTVPHYVVALTTLKCSCLTMQGQDNTFKLPQKQTWNKILHTFLLIPCKHYFFVWTTQPSSAIHNDILLHYTNPHCIHPSITHHYPQKLSPTDHLPSCFV